MTITSRELASGHGWSVRDVVCTAGPGDRPFEERHATVCIAAVTRGTFQYRTSTGAATLAPGALLLGNAGACFACGHEHGVGDRCVSFHFTPEIFEHIVAAVRGARRASFAAASLPPSAALTPLVTAAEAAAPDELEELALRIAGAVVTTLAGSGRASAPSSRDVRRISEAVRRIEAEANESIPLAALADAAGMSRYHFLRTFRAVVGITPHQFVLAQRLRRAAVRLRRTRAPVTTVAYEAGFGDLSTFNRRFRRLMGASPTAYRKGHTS